MKKFILLLFALFAVSFSLQLNAQNQTFNEQSIEKLFANKVEICFTFIVADKNQINNDLTKIISIDFVKALPNNQGYEVRAYANRKEFANFLTRSIPYNLVIPDGSKAYTMATTTAQMASWDRYPVYSVYEQMMADFANNYSSICNMDTILASTPNGHKILVLRISDNVNTAENEPRFLYTSSIHGDETTGYILMLRLINYLLTNYGSITAVTNMVNNIEIWICPLSNPDGTYAVSDNSISNLLSTRSNGNGVDMNRNYPDPIYGDHPDGEAWQPETQAFMTFATNHYINMSVNFHGGAEVMNYPWDSWTSAQNTHPDDNWFSRICTDYITTARLINGSYMTDVVSSGVTEGGDWYTVQGGRQDYMTYFMHGREVTVELDGTKCTETQNLPTKWNENYQSLLDYLEEAQYGIRGLITDSCTGQPMRAKVYVNSHEEISDSSFVYSSLPVGDYHRYLNTGTYSVTYSAPGYASKTVTGISLANGSATTVNVSLAPALPNADFTADVISSCSGIINFTDLTAGGANSWTWNFGDGYGSSAQNPTHTYTANGTYTVTLTVGNCKGTNTETKTAYITINLATAPIVTDGSRCGTGTVNLAASGTGTLNWYDAIGGNWLYTGSNYTTPSLSATTTYYVSQDFSTGSYVGKVDSVGGGMMYNNTTYYLIFTCTTACVLNSVKVYAGSAGDRTVELQNSSGGWLQDTTVYIPAGESRVILNFNVPVGTNMRLRIPSGTTNLYRNSGGITFPYTLAGKISIIGTNAASTRYYFFYDWEIDHTSCTSPQVPVTATIIQPAIPSFTHSEVNLTSYFTNTSTNATSYLWKFGDGATSTQTNPSHTYAAEGDYDVVLIAYNSCGSDSVITTINASTVGGIQNATEAGRISIYPIPSKGIVFLGYQTSISQNCNIEVINMVGDVVLRDKVRFIPGENSTAIDLNSLQTGIYFMKLIMDNSSVVRKIIIE